jgi:hypothetical protein
LGRSAGQGKESTKSYKPPGSFSTPAETRKVADWANLFQDSEEQGSLRDCVVGEYSCTKLLKEMEVVASDSDEEIVDVAVEDEVMTIPDSWIQGGLPKGSEKELTGNLYVLPEIGEGNEGSMDTQMHKEEVKKPEKKWGPVLVEKRPSRQQSEGRTVMEMAQKRKRRANLDGGKGNSNSYNPFSILSNVEITKMTSTVNVDIGKNVSDRIESLAKIQEIDASTNSRFRDNCVRCQEKIVGNDSGSGKCEECGGLEMLTQALLPPRLCLPWLRMRQGNKVNGSV